MAYWDKMVEFSFKGDKYGVKVSGDLALVWRGKRGIFTMIKEEAGWRRLNEGCHEAIFKAAVAAVA